MPYCDLPHPVYHLYHTHMHTHIPLDVSKELSAVVQPLEHKSEEDICNVELISPQSFTMPWNECYAISPQLMVPSKGLSIPPICIQHGTMVSLNHFFSQVKFLNLISNVAQDNRLSEEKQRTHLHPDVGTFILLRKGKDREE